RFAMNGHTGKVLLVGTGWHPAPTTTRTDLKGDAVTSAGEGKKPDPRKAGQNPTGRERRSSAGSRRLAAKKERAERDKG
ncbi:hypothetical protein, partial [Streptomyces sp. NPDC056672]|uniref:hypothetical protein n=1 Tax=Streptomyces sp. NPDC056672 TaxID=3345906 RepID=UPI0036B70068